MPLSDAVQQLEQRLQHPFRQRDLLARALTHRSHSADHNERLEFLGDSVLNLAVSTMLYQALGNLQEGELSRVRANLVKQDTLHKIAQDLRLGHLIDLGEGELRSGGNKRPSILADALEAVIGAVYLDAGFEKASALVYRLFDNVEINPEMPAAAKDAKTALQEWLQGKKHKLPAYKVMSITGAAHRQTFEVQCTVEALQREARGFGSTRRAAEQEAAWAMLKTLQTVA
jgi:ribonuclease III